ncbi:MAG TPA: NAD(P)H-hydrate epimerase, partial [Ornithinimicrobium sp.]|nr:NAD(P)H-hydrate epimerase [Ornithinimicrobium sp.]
MIEGYAVATVREVEDRVRSRLPEGELMQRAARGLAVEVRALAGQLGARSVLVLAGPGDNGGDALWAAALLAGHGDGAAPGAGPGPRSVPAVAVLGIASRLHPQGLEAALAAGCPVTLVDPAAGRLEPQALELLASADLVVDGLLGIGGRPGLRGAMAAAAHALTAGPDRPVVLAVDLPSGTDPAGEEAVEDVLPADVTVTFGVAKPVHLLPTTARAVGRLRIVDIGLGQDLAAERPGVERLETGD